MGSGAPDIETNGGATDVEKEARCSKQHVFSRRWVVGQAGVLFSIFIILLASLVLVMCSIAEMRMLRHWNLP